MKNILLVACLLISIASFAQGGKSVKKWVHPKPIGDSTWVEIKCDTLFGAIEFSVGDGVVKSEGIVTTCRQWDFNKSIYTAKDRASIDSFQNDQMEKFRNGAGDWFSAGIVSSGFSRYPPMKSAYIKTRDGYKRVEGEFVFKPL